MTKYLITEDQAHNIALYFIGIAKVRLASCPMLVQNRVNGESLVGHHLLITALTTVAMFGIRTLN